MRTRRRPSTARLAPPKIVWPLALGVIFAQAACWEDEPNQEQKTRTDAASAQTGEAAQAAGDSSTPPDGAADAAVEGNADPMELDAINGDPALDIASSDLYFDSGNPWVRVTFFGAWPPAQQLHSWQCSILLGTENAPVATYTTQGTSGVVTDFVEGIEKAKMTFVVEPKGFRVRFGEATLAFDRYGLECSVQKTPQGTRVQDTSGNFVVNAKIQRPFGT